MTQSPEYADRRIIYYQGSDPREARSTRLTWADLVHLAAGRMVESAPTIRTMVVPAEDLVVVGTYDPRDGEITLSEPVDVRRVSSWLGTSPDPDALTVELTTTNAAHDERRQIRKLLASSMFGERARGNLIAYARRSGNADLVP